jgi:hypothetical protein
MVPKKTSAPVQTHAATPDEVLAILAILEKAGFQRLPSWVKSSMCAKRIA